MYIVAWRYNGKVHTCSYDSLPDAYDRMNALSVLLSVTEITLHCK